MASYKLEFAVLIVMAAILNFSKAEINATRVASLICGTGGIPKTTPACIPTADMVDLTAISSYSTAASAFLACYPQLATCYTCGADSDSEDASKCTKVADCMLNPATYMKPDTMECFWKFFCTVPASCQVQYQMCVVNSAGKEALEKFEDCVAKNL